MPLTKVLLLGTGLVARPLVRYLLDLGTVFLTTASRTVSRSEKMLEGDKNAKAVALDVSQPDAMDKMTALIRENDIIVSLLPPEFHVKVAEVCIKYKKNMATTSYVSPAMKALDGPAKEAGVVIVNECGVDPGIDHMSAMRVIHNVQKDGGVVKFFRSSTGALPAQEANTNPYGYKFSWAPRGVLLASRNSAKFFRDGELVDIPGPELFKNYFFADIKGVGVFENYPNRDSCPYKELYGLEGCDTVYRGTLRNPGWCETMLAVAELGWLGLEALDNLEERTFGAMTAALIGEPSARGDTLVRLVAEKVKVPYYSAAMKRLEWLKLFGDEALPAGKDAPLDCLNVVSLEMMPLPPGERDMIVMHHEFGVEYRDGRPAEFLTATLVDYGQPEGDTSVARTVALPCAIAVRMIAEGVISAPGVHCPVAPEMYNPILDELEPQGVKFKETRGPWVRK